MATRYFVKDVDITGTQDSPQTIAYADLTDIDGDTLPTTFSATPFIGIGSKHADRGVNIVASSKTVTNFQIALSNLYGSEVMPTTVAVDLLIAGNVP